MPTTCFVPGCNTGLQTCKVKRHMFSVPRDEQLRKKWENLISRSDLSIKPAFVVCDLHFGDDCILKEDKFIINGAPVYLPRDKWKLKKNSIPTLLLDLPISKSKKKRKLPHPRNSLVQNKKSKHLAETSRATCRLKSTGNKSEELSNAEETLDNDWLANDVITVAEPNTETCTCTGNEPVETLDTDWLSDEIRTLIMPTIEWNIHASLGNDDVSYAITEIKFQHPCSPRLSKSILLDRNVLPKVFVGEEECDFSIVDNLKDINEVQALLDRVHSMEVCYGLDPFRSSNDKVFIVHQRVHAKNCALLIHTPGKHICGPCSHLKNKMQTRKGKGNANVRKPALKRRKCKR